MSKRWGWLPESEMPRCKFCGQQLIDEYRFTTDSEPLGILRIFGCGSSMRYGQKIPTAYILPCPVADKALPDE